MSSNRPNIHEYAMNIAKAVATRATCFRKKVGAVIMLDNKILSTGYNGAPCGLPDCFELKACGKEEGCRAVHAEQNAIIFAAKNGVAIKDASIYVTHAPCLNCAKLIINSGILSVYYEKENKDPSGLRYLLTYGPKTIWLKNEKK
jgi:dCMP deaminase